MTKGSSMPARISAPFARLRRSAPVRRISDSPRLRGIALVLLLALAGWGIWQLRLLYHGLFMLLFVRHPALTTIPLLTGGAAFLVHLLFRRARRALGGRGAERAAEPAAIPSTTPKPGALRVSRGDGQRLHVSREGTQRLRVSRKGAKRPDVAEPAPEAASPTPAPRRPRRSAAQPARRDWRPRWRRARAHLRAPAVTFLVFGGIGFLFAAAMTSAWTGAAIYRHADYGSLTLAELRGGEVRIKPYDIARQQTDNGLNSPTERATNLHIVEVDGRLLWTSVRDPEGFFRVLTKPTKGVMSVEAGSTAPRLKQSGPGYDADLRFGPGMRISENIAWQIVKKHCYTCDIAEMTGVPTPEGPVIVVPYIRYEGNWLVRRPTFGGVFLVHADGRIDDLSPREAARHPLLRGTGRVFPEQLARRTADAYKFKKGIWNRLFVHTDQLEVADTESNRQPYLQDLERLGAQWVTTLKPRGRTFTTAGVMTTDALTGRTRVWLARPDQSLIGNQKALDIVRGESFPGIVFADAEEDRTGGRFRVVEPRQVFPGGRLQFLLSIIPQSANRVTMSVLVDAQAQRVVATFDATPEGDADLIAYLRTGERDIAGDGGKGGRRDRQPSVDDTRAPEDRQPPVEEGDAALTLRRLLRENRAEQRRAGERVSDLEAQERDLLRLLRGAERAR